ncbi:MAG: Rrf2 family transcriptional regulator [Verrucomicrobia bacterium]|nr:Rrf2 family transcriptional regulator [Verrucomicrobiota bacterium]MDA1085583.1 Rrf2 family transcriptional regulator [Verrucomicrobiota bacterium]
MRVSQKTEYALKTVLDLAQHGDAGVVSTAHIARRQEIPVKFLEQILITLKNAGVVGSRRGPKGGYFLQQSPAEITVGAIVRLTESRPALPNNGDAAGEYCPFAEMWKEIEEHVHDTLEGLTIKEMCRRIQERSGKKSDAYVI